VVPAEVQLEPAAFRRIGEEVREQLGFKPAEFYRVQLVRLQFVRIDNPVAKPDIAPRPPSLQERCITTPGLIAEVSTTVSSATCPTTGRKRSSPGWIKDKPLIKLMGCPAYVDRRAV